jgi:surface carbohydrate biosynthesis protein
MSRIDVLYLYEHVDRELDVACAVKIIGEQRLGMKIEIQQHPYGQLQSDLTRFQPQIVALPNLYNSDVAYLLDWPNAVYVNLMWEQIFYSGVVGSKLPKGEFALHHVTHHAWSEVSATQLKSVGIPESCITINGHPAFALYQQPYSAVFDNKIALSTKYGLDPDLPWIFFPENFGWAFYTEDQIKLFTSRGLPYESALAMKRYCEQTFNKSMHWCQQLAETKQVEIIVRPRPATLTSAFVQAVEQSIQSPHPHIHVTKSESVREWINASNVVISSYSTSLIEAAIAGKPAYTIQPYPMPDELKADWLDLVAHVCNYDEFEAMLEFKDDSTHTRLRQWARSTLFSHGDPIQGLVTLFDQLLSGHSLNPPKATWRQLELSSTFGLTGWPLATYLKYYRRYERLRRRIFPRVIIPSHTYEKDLISEEDVQRRLERWRKILTS